MHIKWLQVFSIFTETKGDVIAGHFRLRLRHVFVVSEIKYDFLLLKLFGTHQPEMGGKTWTCWQGMLGNHLVDYLEFRFLSIINGVILMYNDVCQSPYFMCVSSLSSFFSFSMCNLFCSCHSVFFLCKRLTQCFNNVLILVYFGYIYKPIDIMLTAAHFFLSNFLKISRNSLSLPPLALTVSKYIHCSGVISESSGTRAPLSINRQSWKWKSKTHQNPI